MKIANQKTFQSFDKLKEDIFAHKKSYFNKNNNSNPLFRSKFVKNIIAISIMTAFSWQLWTNLPKIKQYMLQNKMITYQKSLNIEIWSSFLKCKLKKFPYFFNNKQATNMLNQLYSTRLQSDYQYLTTKTNQKSVYYQTKSKYSLWFISYNNEENIVLFNQYGDLVQRNIVSKIMLGNNLKIWKKTNQKIIKNEKLYQRYASSSIKIVGNCQNIHRLSYFFQKNKEQAIKQCRQFSQVYQDRFSKLLKERNKFYQDKFLKGSK